MLDKSIIPSKIPSSKNNLPDINAVIIITIICNNPTIPIPIVFPSTCPMTMGPDPIMTTLLIDSFFIVCSASFLAEIKRYRAYRFPAAHSPFVNDPLQPAFFNQGKKTVEQVSGILRAAAGLGWNIKSHIYLPSS